MKPLFLLLFAAVLFGGCITDANDQSSTPQNNSIIGIWQDGTNSQRTLSVRGDGTYNSVNFIGHGTYNIYHNRITFAHHDSSARDSDTMKYQVAGNMLSLLDATDNCYYDFMRVTK